MFRILKMKLLSERLALIHKLIPELEGDRGQAGLAKASGASRSVVNQWLHDKIKSIDINYALSIESELGISHIWLMTGQGDPMVRPGERITLVRPGAVEEPRLTMALPIELDLLDLFRRSTDRGQVNIMEAARAAKKKPMGGIQGNQG
jgi:transcriptional regulator with XRE-family HTH domain